MQVLKNSSSESLASSCKKTKRLETECSSNNDEDSFLSTILSPKNGVYHQRFEHVFLEVSEQHRSVDDSQQPPNEEDGPCLRESGPITLQELSEINHYLQKKFDRLKTQVGSFTIAAGFLELYDRVDRLERQINLQGDDQILRQCYDEKLITDLQGKDEFISRELSLNKPSQSKVLAELQRQLNLREADVSRVRQERELLEEASFPNLSLASSVSKIRTNFLASPRLQSYSSSPRLVRTPRQTSFTSEKLIQAEILSINAFQLKIMTQMSHECQLYAFSEELSAEKAATDRQTVSSVHLAEKKEEFARLSRELQSLLADGEYSDDMLQQNRFEILRLRREKADNQRDLDYAKYLCNTIDKDTREYQDLMEENYKLQPSITAAKLEMQRQADLFGGQELLNRQEEIFALSQELSILKPLNDSIEQWNKETRQLAHLEAEIEQQTKRYDEKHAYVEKKRRDIRMKEHLYWSCLPVHPAYLEDVQRKVSLPSKEPKSKRSISNLFFARGPRGYRRIRTSVVSYVILAIFAAVYFGLMLHYIMRTVK